MKIVYLMKSLTYWKAMLYGKYLTDEEPMSALFHLLMLYKAQLYYRLVLSSCTHPHLSECELAFLSIQIPLSIVLSSALAHLLPSHCLLPSLDQYLSHPRNPSCRAPVCSALWHLGGGHPSWVLSFSELPLEWQTRQRDRTSASLASVGVTLFIMGI